MIPSPDLGAQAGSAKSRANLVADQSTRLILLDKHGGHVVFVVEGLVLDRDGVNVRSSLLKRLEVLDKVLSIGILVSVVELVVAGATANQLAVLLHPSRRRPRRSKDSQVGLQLAHSCQHAGQGIATVAQVEVDQVRINAAVAVVESVSRIS